jgi:hypothetical protein
MLHAPCYLERAAQGTEDHDFISFRHPAEKVGPFAHNAIEDAQGPVAIVIDTEGSAKKDLFRREPDHDELTGAHPAHGPRKPYSGEEMVRNDAAIVEKYSFYIIHRSTFLN